MGNATLLAAQRSSWLAGQRTLVEDYLRSHPVLTEQTETLEDLIYQEYCLRLELGERPEPEEYYRRFPAIRPALEKLFDVNAALMSDHLGVTGFTRDPQQTLEVAADDERQQSTDVSRAADDTARLAALPEARDGATRWAGLADLAALGDTADFVIGMTSDPSGKGDLAGSTSGIQQRPQAVGKFAAAGTKGEIGRFQILAILGEGSFGTVYRAFDPELERNVAIKVPRQDLADSESDIEGFLREARAAARLRHPHIVPIYEVGRTNEGCYIVSALVSGCTMRDQMRKTRFTHRAAATLIADLADALHFAHQHGIVHRDVKPENILLDDSGDPQLLDFGLAKRPSRGESALATQAGDRFGTPSYMSPEVVMGMGHQADARSDLWALGVILYEILTNRRPFSAGNIPQLFQSIVHESPADPRKIDPSIPLDLALICSRCLEKLPSRRYVSCEVLADELRRWLAGGRLRVWRKDIDSYFSRWMQGNQFSVLLLIFIGLLTFIVFVLGVRLRNAYQTENERNSPEQQLSPRP